jgi:cytochrome c-type biogenesis protein CcmH/NrfF
MVINLIKQVITMMEEGESKAEVIDTVTKELV